MKTYFVIIFLSALSFLCVSWGSSGHYWISNKSALSFPVSMNQLLFWADSLAAHGSDADDRKSWDPDESMRHYINIDNYAEFNATGHIPSTMDSVVNAHGLSFVEDAGTLPWSTKKMHDSLRLSFQQHDWHAAMLHASDLGHYVGDGHMPLHITKNYNGQYTGQTGIHSRYESDMVYDYINQLHSYSGIAAQYVSDVQTYIFNYLYVNYTYVDSILDADTYAENIAGNTYSTQYYVQLFNKSKNFTITLWQNASHALAELIYTAWVDAGSPQITSDELRACITGNTSLNISPNPARAKSVCYINSPVAGNADFLLYDMSGKIVWRENINCSTGTTVFNADFSELPEGSYFGVLLIENKKAACKLVVMK